MRALLIGTALAAVAHAVAAQNCEAVQEDLARLRCWDQAAAARRAGAAAESIAPKTAIATAVRSQSTIPTAPIQIAPSTSDPKSWPWGSNDGPSVDTLALDRVHVRDKLTMPYEDAKAANLTLTSSNSEQVLKTTVAMIYDLPYHFLRDEEHPAGWSTWVGAQWVKDGQSKKPVDSRLYRFAGLGQYGTEIKLLIGSTLDYSEDKIAHNSTVGLRPEITPVFSWTEGGIPYSSADWAYSALFRFGAQMDRVHTNKATAGVVGNAVGLNVRMSLNYYPGGVVAPLRLFSETVRATDLYADSIIGKRNSTYNDFGMEWMFTRPDKKPGAIAPTLSLHRTIGANFLSGLPRTVQTVIAFGLKAN